MWERHINVKCIKGRRWHLKRKITRGRRAHFQDQTKTDLSQAPSLAQSGGFSPIDGDRLLLARLAGPQKASARTVRRTGVQNVRMRHVFDRLVRLVRLAGLVGLVGVRRAGLEVGRSVCRYHWRGVVRVESVARLRPGNRFCIFVGKSSCWKTKSFLHRWITLSSD